VLEKTIMSLKGQTVYRASGNDCPKVSYYQADLIVNQGDNMAREVREAVKVRTMRFSILLVFLVAPSLLCGQDTFKLKERTAKSNEGQVLLGIFWLAAAPQTLPAQGNATNGIDAAQAKQYFDEASKICRRDAGNLWGAKPVRADDLRRSSNAHCRCEPGGRRVAPETARCSFRRLADAGGEHREYSHDLGRREMDHDSVAVAGESYGARPPDDARTLSSLAG
jgi:hypothetical protein